MLLVLPAQPGFALLKRVSSTVHALDGELHVFCPFVQPRIPATEVTLAGPVELHDHGVTRASATRFANRTAEALKKHDLDADVEFGLFPTMTEGVLDAAERIDPDLLILPRISRAGIFDRSFAVAYEQIWSRLGITTWIMHHGVVADQAILGLIAMDSSIDDRKSENERVAATTTEFAKALNVQAHLLCSESKSKVVELAEAALSLQITKVSGDDEKEVVRDLSELARKFDIPNTRIHLDRGNEDDVIERIVDPLGVGLIITHGRPRTTFGGLFAHHDVPDIGDAQCDLVVLGDDDEPPA